MLRARCQDCTSIMAKISSVCLPKAKKEQDSSVGVTFSKIMDKIDAIDFRLREWAMETGIDSVHDFDDDFKDTSKKVIDNLNRLASTLKKLCTLCSKATPTELAKQEDTRSLDSADEISDNEGRNYLTVLVPISTEIQQLLSSIDTQMQTLSLLSEPLQYSATKNIFRETVGGIVAASERYCGSKDALKRYSVDEKLFGSEAIRAAQDLEAKMELDARMEKIKFAESSTKPYLGRGRKTERQEKFIGDLSPHIPTYVKVKREYVSSETLKYYDIPWEVDSRNPEYIIILREMDESETDILFEHTRRLRQTEQVSDGRPAPEERQLYAFVRKQPRRHASRKGRDKIIESGPTKFTSQ